MKAESWEFVFSEKCDVVRVKDSPLFELTRVLVGFNHIARFIENAMILTRLRSRKRKKQSASFSPALVMKQFSIYELSSHEAARDDS
jgi:hypothetical protein